MSDTKRKASTEAGSQKNFGVGWFSPDLRDWLRLPVSVQSEKQQD